MLYKGIIEYHKDGEGVSSKQRMMLSFVLFLAFPLCSVIANCPSEPKGQNSIIQKLRVFLSFT